MLTSRCQSGVNRSVASRDTGDHFASTDGRVVKASIKGRPKADLSRILFSSFPTSKSNPILPTPYIQANSFSLASRLTTLATHLSAIYPLTTRCHLTLSEHSSYSQFSLTLSITFIRNAFNSNSPILISSHAALIRSSERLTIYSLVTASAPSSHGYLTTSTWLQCYLICCSVIDVRQLRK